MSALISSGVDLLACETLPATMEALALLELVREFPGTRAWFTFSCKVREGEREGGTEGVFSEGYQCLQPVGLPISVHVNTCILQY